MVLSEYNITIQINTVIMITTNQRLIDIFLTITKIDGISGNERTVADYILKFLTELGLSPVEDTSYLHCDGNAGNIICRFGNGGERILVSHMDTALPTRGLRHVFSNGKISSDGTTILGADNRAGVSVLLYLADQICRNNTPHLDFTIAFTVDEESSLSGSKNLQLDSSLELGFVFDSAFRPGTFVRGSCGAITFTIEIEGKAAHAGLQPEKGKSAIRTAGDIITKLPSGRIDGDTTCNIGMVSGGSAVNVVPAHALIKGEIRSPDTTKIRTLVDRITELAADTASRYETDVRVGYRWDFKPYLIHEHENVYSTISDAIRTADLAPLPVTTCGGSDANSLNEKGITSVNIGIGAQNPHSTDEFIFIEDLEKSSEIAFNLIKV
jgi:tripeptide aminopeptidase